ncbi:MAG TPA: substrate-binding domain-containing protein, partial [Candidatus Methylacidiphilales bacterium]|nr:substrate-binding domain-containing protein [Candidatus Methylacidiphilales bacterium]
HPSIPEGTRSRIIDLAREHGYTPDPLVSKLMTQLRTSRRKRSAEKLAYLTWWPTEYGWRECTNDVILFEGARDRALQIGYEFEHIWAKAPRLSAARLSKILYTRAIRGLIIGPPDPVVRPLAHISLDWKYFSCAAIGLSIVKPDLHTAAHHHYHGTTLALRKMRYHGYQRIGFAARTGDISRNNNSWLAGYHVYNQMLPRERQVGPYMAEDQRNIWDRDALARWIDREKPDAVLSTRVEAYLAMKDLGIRVPEDIGFATLDLFETQVTWLKLESVIAGIDQKGRTLGAAAVDLVDTQLRSNEYGLPVDPRKVMLEGMWHEGTTLVHKKALAATVQPGTDAADSGAWAKG